MLPTGVLWPQSLKSANEPLSRTKPPKGPVTPEIALQTPKTPEHRPQARRLQQAIGPYRAEMTKTAVAARQQPSLSRLSPRAYAIPKYRRTGFRCRTARRAQAPV